MKRKIIFLLISACCLDLAASVKCFVKIGFADCVNCFNLLSIVDGFEKEYVFKEEYRGIEAEILKERFGIEGKLKIHTSDSFFNSFGFGDFTALSFYKDDNLLFSCPLSQIDKWSTIINKLKNSIVQEELVVNLNGIWHDQCQIRLSDSKKIIILDPLLNRLNMLDVRGTLLHEFSISNQFVEEIYQAKFGVETSELKDFYKIRDVSRSKIAAINFNNISVWKNLKYVLITGHYFIINKPDTILASFLSIVRFDDDFNYKIINVNSTINSEYFLGQNYFQIINDSTVLFDVISTNPSNPKYIISENRISKNVIDFFRFYADTIPYGLVDKRLNYRVTSFTHDNGYIAFFMFNKIYKNSRPLSNSKLFDSYNFSLKFPNPKNYVASLRKNDDLLYISYQIDTLNHVAIYNLNVGEIIPSIISIPVSKLNTFIQLDYPGLVYFVNKEKQLIKYKL